jgi:hypothetical protein
VHALGARAVVHAACSSIAPQLLERARLDLPHALARDAEVLARLASVRAIAVEEAVADREICSSRCDSERSNRSTVSCSSCSSTRRSTDAALVSARRAELLERLGARVLVERAQPAEQRRSRPRADRDVELARDLVERRLAPEPLRTSSRSTARSGSPAGTSAPGCGSSATARRCRAASTADPDRRVGAEAQAPLGLEPVGAWIRPRLPSSIRSSIGSPRCR